MKCPHTTGLSTTRIGLLAALRPEVKGRARSLRRLQARTPHVTPPSPPDPPVCLPSTCHKDACWIWGWVIQISSPCWGAGRTEPSPTLSPRGAKAAACQRWGEQPWKTPNLCVPLTSQLCPLQPRLGIIPGTVCALGSQSTLTATSRGGSGQTQVPGPAAKGPQGQSVSAWPCLLPAQRGALGPPAP